MTHLRFGRKPPIDHDIPVRAETMFCSSKSPKKAINRLSHDKYNYDGGICHKPIPSLARRHFWS